HCGPRRNAGAGARRRRIAPAGWPLCRPPGRRARGPADRRPRGRASDGGSRRAGRRGGGVFRRSGRCRRAGPRGGAFGRRGTVQGVARREGGKGAGKVYGVAAMLYFLLYTQLYKHISPLRVFGYTTSRTAFASLTALFLCIALGPWLINKLRYFQIGQYIREEGPKSHQKKAGTPTMGGVLIIISIVVPTLLWPDLSNRFVWIAVLATCAFAAIGFTDDYTKVIHKRNLGLTARAKLGLQILTSILVAVALIAMDKRELYSTKLVVPFLKQFHPDLVIDNLKSNPDLWPLAFLPFIIFVVLLIV